MRPLSPARQAAQQQHERAETSISAETRAFVLERDNNQCQCCGTGGENRLQLHHWAAYRSQGGGHGPANLVTVCTGCHRDIHNDRLDVELVEVRPGVWSAFCYRKNYWQWVR